jgi:hypothetical protein
MNYSKLIETILGFIWLFIVFMAVGIAGSIELGVL